MRKTTFNITVLLCFSSLCFACSNRQEELSTIGDLQFYCFPEKLTTEQWVQRIPIIFVGNAKKVKWQLDSYKIWFNGCWADFEVTEQLKGQVARNTLLRAYYEPYDFKNKRYKDLRDASHCPIKEGSAYLVFGYNRGSQKTIQYIATAKSEETECTPLVDLKSSPEKLDEVKSILNRQRRK